MAVNLGSSFSRPELGGKTVRANAEEEEPGTAKVVEAIAEQNLREMRVAGLKV